MFYQFCAQRIRARLTLPLTSNVEPVKDRKYEKSPSLDGVRTRNLLHCALYRCNATNAVADKVKNKNLRRTGKVWWNGLEESFRDVGFSGRFSNFRKNFRFPDFLDPVFGFGLFRTDRRFIGLGIGKFRLDQLFRIFTGVVVGNVVDRLIRLRVGVRFTGNDDDVIGDEPRVVELGSGSSGVSGIFFFRFGPGSWQRGIKTLSQTDH